MTADLDLPIPDIPACAIDWHGIPEPDHTDGRDRLKMKVLGVTGCRSTGRQVTCLDDARTV